MPHTFFPDAVAFLSVVTEKDRSPTKIQFLFILIFPCFKKKKLQQSQTQQQQSKKNNHYHGDYVLWIFI